MSYKSKELRETRGSLAKQMAELVSKAKGENRGLNAEERQQFDRMDTEQKKLLDEAEGFERIESFEDGLVSETRNKKVNTLQLENRVANDPKAGFMAWLADKAGCMTREQEENATRQGYDPRHKVFECRATTDPQLSTSATLGGALVPVSLANFIDSYMLATSPIMQVARVINTASGETLKVPTADDTANAAVIIAQNTADVVNNITTTTVNLASYMFTSNIVLLPIEWIRDAAFPVQEWVGQQLAKRFSRGISSYLATGSGSGQPQGYVTGTTTTSTTLASAFAVTYAECVDALYDVPLFYRNSPGFAIMCSDSFAAALRSQIATTGSPIWQPSMSAGQPDTYLGKRLFVDPYLDAMGATGNTVAVLGDFSEFLVRKVGNWEIHTAQERYFEYRQIGIVGFGAIDSKMLQPGAFVKIKTPAS